MASFHTFPIACLFGNKILLSKKLPNKIVNIPARVNRYPANKICIPAASDGMENISYPILIHGNALPHNAQHNNASNATIHPLCRYFSFFICFRVISFLCRLLHRQHKKEIPSSSLSHPCFLRKIIPYFPLSFTKSTKISTHRWIPNAPLSRQIW